MKIHSVVEWKNFYASFVRAKINLKTFFTCPEFSRILFCRSSLLLLLSSAASKAWSLILTILINYLIIQSIVLAKFSGRKLTWNFGNFSVMHFKTNVISGTKLYCYYRNLSTLKSYPSAELTSGVNENDGNFSTLQKI